MEKFREGTPHWQKPKCETWSQRTEREREQHRTPEITSTSGRAKMQHKETARRRMEKGRKKNEQKMERENETETQPETAIV
jgi:hypothetical protein